MRSRTATAIHKAFGKQKKENVRFFQSDIDACNNADIKYHDQTNNASIADIMHKNTADFMKACQFQQRYIHSWNVNLSEVSQVVYLELSKFDKISNDGCIQMLVELLHDYGLIEKDKTRKGHYKPVDNLEHKRLRIYGDCLLMEKIRHMMHNRIYSVVTHPGKNEFVH